MRDWEAELEKECKARGLTWRVCSESPGGTPRTFGLEVTGRPGLCDCKLFYGCDHQDLARRAVEWLRGQP